MKKGKKEERTRRRKGGKNEIRRHLKSGERRKGRRGEGEHVLKRREKRRRSWEMKEMKGEGGD